MTKNKAMLLLAICAVAVFVAGKYIWNKRQAEKKQQAIKDLSDPAKMNTGIIPVTSSFASPASVAPVTSSASLNAGQQQQQGRLEGTSVANFMN